MKKNLFKIGALTLFLGGLSFMTLAQEVSPVEFKTGRAAGHMNLKKLKKADNRIYIAEFFVNYQLMYSDSEVARGGRELGGGYRGDAKASLILGVPGIEVDKLQQNTDRIYQEYLDLWKSAGYEILGPEAAVNASTLEGWEQLTGGTVSEAQNPGYLFTAPSGFNYYAKKITKKGRAKTGLMDYTMKLSKDMDGVIVARVSLILPVAEDAESQGSKSLTKTFGGVAKVVAKPSYRIAPSQAVQTGKMSGTTVNSIVNYAWMKSLGDQAFVSFKLKDPVTIDGVFEDKKYKAVESADQDLWGTQMGALQVFRVDDKAVQRMQALECDPDKFIDGAYQATSNMVRQSVKDFLAMKE